jgi:diacylglycerol kinase (ATP)
VKRLLWAAINSWHGLVAAARSEAAFRQELILLVVGAPTAFWLTPSASERLVLIGALVVLLIVELLNTAIEKLADRVTMERDDMVRRVKDMGSAAVGLTILLAVAVWAVIAWQRLGL